MRRASPYDSTNSRATASASSSRSCLTCNELIERFWQILQLRGTNPRLFEFCATPYEAITPHLLRHRNSFAHCYVLLSESKKALYLDFGYDLVTGGLLGSDRASRLAVAASALRAYARS